MSSTQVNKSGCAGVLVIPVPRRQTGEDSLDSQPELVELQTSEIACLEGKTDGISRPVTSMHSHIHM